MGLFDRKIKDPKYKEAKADAALSLAEFFKKCVDDYHAAAKEQGFATHGLIHIPELLDYGKKAVLALLQDDYFQTVFQDEPQMYYYAVMSLSLQAGIVFADKWHADPAALQNGYADQIIGEGPADACKPLLQELGLSDEEKENDFYHVIYERWLALHELYWKQSDPRQYTFMATLAAYQLGISMILEKRGY